MPIDQGNRFLLANLNVTAFDQNNGSRIEYEMTGELGRDEWWNDNDLWRNGFGRKKGSEPIFSTLPGQSLFAKRILSYAVARGFHLTHKKQR